MKMEGLTAFVAASRAGSISEAARQLRLSKSAVSERLAELERTLGAHLVQRNSRQFALTEDGHAFLERAQRIVAEARHAADELAERRGEISGPLRIAAPRGFGDSYFGRALFSFMEDYPDVTVTAEFDDRVSEAAGGYDAIVRIGAGPLPKLAVRTLTTSRRTLVAAPAYLAKHGRPTSVDDLTRHHAVHYMERGPDDWTFRTGLEQVVARVEPRLRVTSCTAMRDAAIAGLGIAMLPTFHSHDALVDGRLEVLDVGVGTDVTPITLAYQNGIEPSTKLTALIEHLKRAFGDPPYWDRGLTLPPLAAAPAV
jgi:DNA-binding transcriptional LysR family regulator